MFRAFSERSSLNYYTLAPFREQRSSTTGNFTTDLVGSQRASAALPVRTDHSPSPPLRSETIQLLWLLLIAWGIRVACESSNDGDSHGECSKFSTTCSAVRGARVIIKSVHSIARVRLHSRYIKQKRIIGGLFGATIIIGDYRSGV